MFQLVVEFADVRILALGVLHKPRSSFILNRNARIFLHPPGVEKDDNERETDADEWQSARSSISSEFSHTIVDPPPTIRSFGQSSKGIDYFVFMFIFLDWLIGDLKQVYRRLAYPLPTPAHQNYPFYTPGGEDKRWFGSGDDEEGGKQWVGPLM